MIFFFKQAMGEPVNQPLNPFPEEWSHRMAPTSLTTFLIDSKGFTPLMRSIYTGSYSIAESLLEAQARVDVRDKNGLKLGF